MLLKFKKMLIKMTVGVCLVATLSSLPSIFIFNNDSNLEYIIKPSISEIQEMDVNSISVDIISSIENLKETKDYSDLNYQYIKDDLNKKMSTARDYIMQNGLSSDFYEKFTPKMELVSVLPEQIAINPENNSFLKQSLMSRKTYTESEEAMNDLSKILEIVRTTRITSASIGALSAIAAVGFWAAAFWTFGATTPWAVGCTLVSTLCGGIYAASSLASIKYDKELSAWKKASIALSSILKLGNVIASICYTVFITSTATITATSWVFPAVLSILPLATLAIVALENFR